MTEELVEFNNSIKWYNKLSTATLDCPIEGIPAPNITWQFNATDLSQDRIKSGFQIDPDNSTLKLFDLNESSQGVYVCSAFNEFGFASFRYKIQLASNYF